MNDQFSQHAHMYDAMWHWPFRQGVERPTIAHLVGDVTGARILDLGCGAGIYSRWLRKCGADRVVGLDRSAGMLAYCREQETREPLGIEYTDQLLRSMEGAFDLVLGVYVLPYAATKAELAALCQEAGSALREGGRFLTLPINPAYHSGPEYYAKYGLRMLTPNPRTDGSQVRVELSWPPYTETLTAYYWTAESLEQTLVASGFGDIRWRHHHTAPHHEADIPASFWDDYINVPHASIIDCTRQRGSQPQAQRQSTRASGRKPEHSSLADPASDHWTVTHPSSDSIPDEEWNTLLSSDGFYQSLPWIKGVERAHETTPIITVRGNSGLRRNDQQDDQRFCLRELMSGLPGDWEEPYLWGGVRRCTYNSLLVASGPLRRETVRALSDTARSTAWEAGKQGVVIPYMPLADAQELADAHPESHAVLHSADAGVWIDPQGWQGVQSRLPAKDRRRQRSEMRHYTSNGGEVTWERMTPALVREIAPLIANTRTKHGRAEHEERVLHTFEAQRRSGVLGSAVACVSRHGGEITAVTVCYQFADRLHARYFGADYSRRDTRFDYFVTGYYEPIDHAARSGARFYHLSIEALETKVRRGATLFPLAAVVGTFGPSPLTPETVSAHNSRFVRSYREHFSRRPYALDDRWKDALSPNTP
ncbi:ubiquinone/menaquinone biosynthesis C-methylase UbiE [Haloactinospora alba]|uniref:Ubiquinone/menaquinone biosynthesis C-methylase UbiE n=1 Tax=Haloactinospora alba TaxID=405555 RepID=A0A543NFE2_9ACTN|nr:methyltransferase domain-containing protein [Haloactinospora alba]TQN30552.1 ubiquinone/menaquinone biosynthesis C-methylase UbiE [Haloactinospora alba]